MPLFEVAMVKRPTPNEIELGIGEKLVLPPTWVLAKDKPAASVEAVRTGQLDPKVDMNLVDIYIRQLQNS